MVVAVVDEVAVVVEVAVRSVVDVLAAVVLQDIVKS